MPYPDRMTFALDKLFKHRYLEAKGGTDECLVLKEQGQYLLIESKESGYTELQVQISGTNLCVTAFDRIPVWGIIDDTKENGMKKGVDHVLFSQKEDGTWKAYLIEMKTTMSPNSFEHVRAKVRSNYYSVKALCVYLGISLSDEDLEVYVTYESLNGPTDPAMMRAPIGTKPTNAIYSEWRKNRITIQIPDDLTLPLVAVQMERVPRNGAGAAGSATALVGSIQL